MFFAREQQNNLPNCMFGVWSETTGHGLRKISPAQVTGKSWDRICHLQSSR